MLTILSALFILAAGPADEIRALSNHADVQAALSTIEASQPRSLEDLVTLTEIPAPPFGERPRAEAFARMMRETGFGEVRLDAEGNVIATRKGDGDGPTVAVVAHLDTVFPEGTDVTVRRDGDSYKAPGVGDNSRGLVLLLELARAFVAADLRTEGDILLIGNVGEEGLGDLRGTKALFAPGAPAIDSFIAVDGGQPNRLVHGAIGSYRYRVAFEGPGGHSWGDFGDANPHHAMGRFISRFIDAADPVTRAGPKSSFNIGVIEGGTSVNSIPYSSAALVDMRSGDRERLDLLDEAMRGAADAALGAENAWGGGRNITLKLERIGTRPAGTTPRDAPLVQRAAEAMRAFALDPEYAASSTDANIPISLGVPAITLPRGGRSEGAHGLEEVWHDENTPEGTAVVLLTLLAEARLSPPL